MKLLVQSTGPHFYQDPNTMDEIDCNRPSVVRPSQFVNNLTGAQKIKVLANDLIDEVTDQEFARFVTDSKSKDGKVDMELAVSSFLSKFRSVTEADQEQSPTTTLEDNKDKADSDNKDKADSDNKDKADSDKADSANKPATAPAKKG